MGVISLALGLLACSRDLLLSRYQHGTGLVTLSNHQVIFSYSYYASLSFICQATFTLLLYAQSQYYQTIYKQRMYE